MRHSKPLARLWAVTAFVVIFQLLVVQAMVASGWLHKRCHDHADDPAHECAVTMVLHGGYDDVVPDIAPVDVAAEAPDVPVLAPQTGDIEPSHLVGGVLAHAPPRGP